MSDTIAKDSLVLYKGRPALVTSSADKLELTLQDGNKRSVRVKDVSLLHPGPLSRLTDLEPEPEGDLETAWELLAGETTTLEELSELMFDAFTPPTAWATWMIVVRGLHFQGTPDEIKVRTREEIEAEQQARDAREAEEKAWKGLVERVRTNKIIPADHAALSGVIALARGRIGKQRILRELNIGSTPEGAHGLLLRLGLWDETDNPHPHRLELPLQTPDFALPELPDEERLDLTHLPAFAIDDEGNQDPDDALSIDGNVLWVHVADVAALIQPGTPADQEARNRASNFYHPEGVVHMLPPRATELLGLGLQEISPAFSFGLTLDEQFQVTEVAIRPTLVRVTRLSYAEVEGRLEEAPFDRFHSIAEAFRARRKERGAAMIGLPEVKVQVDDGKVSIRPLPRLRSREMVTEAMLMAGEAAARYALEHHIPIPFTTQAAPDRYEDPQDMAAMFAYRKCFKASQNKTVAEPHAGLGLEVYARATSPLRRYMDLVVHQQLRAHLTGNPILNGSEVLARVGVAEAVVGSVRRAERLSNKHWTLVYLMQNPEWQGTGTLVEVRGKRGRIIISELGLETQVGISEHVELNAELGLKPGRIRLPDLEISFRVE